MIDVIFQSFPNNGGRRVVTKGLAFLMGLLGLGCLPAGDLMSATAQIPKVYSHISSDDSGRLVFAPGEDRPIPRYYRPGRYGLSHFRNGLTGTARGLAFDFGDSTLSGALYYGFIYGPDEARYAYPIYFKSSAKIAGGKAEIDIAGQMIGAYDIINWQKTGIVRLGYRVVNSEGRLIYDGKIMLDGTGPFAVDTSIIEGPFIDRLGDRGAVVSFETNFAARGEVVVDERRFDDSLPATHHEITLSGLRPDQEYTYEVRYGRHRDRYSFRTAPAPGSRTPFVFAFASDGRGGPGGGERNIYGVNGYIVKRIVAACAQAGVRFLQFTGDMVDGYALDIDEIDLQYSNWKRVIEPFAAYFPVTMGMGNHESVVMQFGEEPDQAAVDRFPFATESAEAIFARNVVNPVDGPVGEDGAAYDPDPVAIDFPTYAETVYSYVYDNVAMIVLNADYWYSYTLGDCPATSGNPHGYIMDNQLAWLRKRLEALEGDSAIDHILVSLHTPLFPNGGHLDDAMWYGGSNTPRAIVAGRPVLQGIIERRDELLDLLVNRSAKVRAILVGDEHNYCRLSITDDMIRYPADYAGRRLVLSRPLLQITDGAAGAPYYGREEAPWSNHVQSFTAQPAVVFFSVEGKQISARVMNPDTMNEIDTFDL